VISLVHNEDLPYGDPTWPVIWQMTRDQFVEYGILAPAKVIDIPESPAKRRVRDEAITLLVDASVRKGRRPVSFSRPILHRMLLALVSDSDADPAAVERAWVLLDELESVSADSWLTATKAEVDRAFEHGRSCVVTARTAMEARYIADYLDTTGRPGGTVVNAETPLGDRRVRLENLSPGACLVSTAIAADSAELIPSGTTVVLWPSQSTRTLLDQLSWRRPGRDVTVVELRANRAADIPSTATPPLSDV